MGGRGDSPVRGGDDLVGEVDRGYDTLSKKGRDRLAWVFATDDPTDELSAAWGVKEQLRRLLASTHVETAGTEKMILGCYVLAADMEESWRL